jgi:hypothetical protein
MIDLKLENIFVGSAVAYHTESVSRKKDKNIVNGTVNDYKNHLFPIFIKNYNIYIKYL